MSNPMIPLLYECLEKNETEETQITSLHLMLPFATREDIIILRQDMIRREIKLCKEKGEYSLLYYRYIDEFGDSK
jgi:hypothetical protein